MRKRWPDLLPCSSGCGRLSQANPRAGEARISSLTERKASEGARTPDTNQSTPWSDARDFLVSYTEADEQAAEWISWALEEAGYTVLFQKWDFVPGGNFVLEMDRAARLAKRTILVLSKALLAKPFPAAEWAAAFAADPAGWERKLVPVRVDDVDPPGLLRQVTYLDLVGLDEEQARRRLIQGLRTRAKPDVAPPFRVASGELGALRTVAPKELLADIAPLEGFLAPEGGRPDRSSFGGIGILRVQVAPIDAFHHPHGNRVGRELERATRDAASAVSTFVAPDMTPKVFDWIQRFEPRGSAGWQSGRASDDFDVLLKHLLAAVTYSLDGQALSFMVSMGLLGEAGDKKVAFEHLWAAELIGALLIAGRFYSAVDATTALRVDLALQGLDNAVSWADSRGRAFTPDQPKITDAYFEERAIVPAGGLSTTPDAVARLLLDRLFMTVDRGKDVVDRIKP
jgi:hypothetical protein